MSRLNLHFVFRFIGRFYSFQYSQHIARRHHQKSYLLFDCTMQPIKNRKTLPFYVISFCQLELMHSKVLRHNIYFFNYEEIAHVPVLTENKVLLSE